MKRSNFFISLLCIVLLITTSNIFSFNSNAGVSDNLFQNDLTELKSKDKNLEDRIFSLETAIKNEHPIGSLYLSLDATNPGTLYGGTWNLVEEGRMLMTATSGAGTTGGNSNITLAANQIPSLSVSGTTDSTGSGMSASSWVNSYAQAGGWRTTSESGNHTHAQAVGVNNGVGSGFSRYDYAGENYNVAFYYQTDTSVNGNHTHSYYDENQYCNGISTTVSGVDPHTHTFTGNYINNAQQALDITNPYIKVYVWKKIS